MSIGYIRPVCNLVDAAAVLAHDCVANVGKFAILKNQEVCSTLNACFGMHLSRSLSSRLSVFCLSSHLSVYLLALWHAIGNSSLAIQQISHQLAQVCMT